MRLRSGQRIDQRIICGPAIGIIAPITSRLRNIDHRIEIGEAGPVSFVRATKAARAYENVVAEDLCRVDVRSDVHRGFGKGTVRAAQGPVAAQFLPS